MNKKRKMSFSTVGGSSILTIFAVLCFIVFALLSLSTAKADDRLSEKSVETTSLYYEADTRAEEILALLRRGEVPEEVTAEGGGLYSYSCPMGGSMELQVQVKIKGKKYRILKWKRTYTGEWQPDNSLDVFDGMVTL